MPRISTRALIHLCHRVGVASRSGIDARRMWELEERHATGPLKDALAMVRRQVAAGGTVAEGMQATGGFFPHLVVQMAAVGEQTGKLDEVLLRLAEHYQHFVSMRRLFLFGIAWPLFELLVAVLVIGLVIYITGMIASSGGGQPVDLLGVGLTGTRGAVIWFLLCGLLAGLIAFAIYALVRGWLGPRPMLVAMRLPVIGKCLEAFALSRLSWSLALALESGMDARRAVEMSIRAAQNPYYESSLPRVTAGIRANRQFHESFADAKVFPTDFLQQLEAAEEAGATSESLLRLAKEYEDRARTAMRVLTGVTTVGVMLLVFGVLIYLIFTMAFQVYFKPINEMLEMSRTGQI